MHHNVRGKRARALPGLALAGLAALAGGCNTDKVIAVSDPNSLTPGAVNTSGATPALAQGAIFLFRGGYSGFGGDAFLSSSALVTDEFYWGDTFTTRQAIDQRVFQPASLGNVPDGAFVNLQQARIQARRAYAQAVNFSTASTASSDSVTRATMRTIEGYVYVTLSEGWCGSVPFSIVPDSGTIDPTALTYTAPIGTVAMNDSAIARFNEALALNPNYSLAKIGKARALLNEGRFSDAAAAVTSVTDTYVYLLEHSANSGNENNPIASLQQNGRYGVSNLEGGTTTSSSGVVSALRPDASSPALTNAAAAGLPFRAIADPRIPFELSPYKSKGACFSTAATCFINDNYPTFASSVPLASGVEARLIEAEAAYQAGDYTTMLAKLNALRANAANLIPRLYPQQKQVYNPITLAALPASAVADQNTARQTMWAERAYWLFNTGHRQGDLRRYARAPYNFATNKLFPSGPYFRNGNYGNDVAFPVPFNEINNPNYNPASCSTTTP